MFDGHLNPILSEYRCWITSEVFDHFIWVKSSQKMFKIIEVIMHIDMSEGHFTHILWEGRGWNTYDVFDMSEDKSKFSK